MVHERVVQASPSSVLKEEHRVIERVLSVLHFLVTRAEGKLGFERASFQRCVQFFRLFADACHHAKEEDLLFPVLEARGMPREGGPIGVMLQEHTQARHLIKMMGEALEAAKTRNRAAELRFLRTARDYLALLSDHIQKEDCCLLRLSDRVLTARDRLVLGKKFADAGRRAFEGKRREELEEMADQLEKQWLLN
ncbi:MAG: hemerythrin domain-containing protein [Planctomycetota bacterium]